MKRLTSMLLAMFVAVSLLLAVPATSQAAATCVNKTSTESTIGFPYKNSVSSVKVYYRACKKGSKRYADATRTRITVGITSCKKYKVKTYQSRTRVQDPFIKGTSKSTKVKCSAPSATRDDVYNAPNVYVNKNGKPFWSVTIFVQRDGKDKSKTLSRDFDV